MAGTIVRWSGDDDCGLTVGLQVRQHPRRSHLRDVDDDVQGIVLNAQSGRTCAVRFELLVSRADVNSDTGVQEGPEFRVDHADRVSIPSRLGNF